MTAPYTIPVRVYYEDTDAGGVVYYASYLRFMERARSEWLRSMGLDVREVGARQGVVFAVRSIALEYFRPAHLSDLLSVGVRLEDCGRASLRLAQEVRRAAELLCAGRVRLACLDAATAAPRRLPPSIVEKIEAWRTSSQ